MQKIVKKFTSFNDPIEAVFYSKITTNSIHEAIQAYRNLDDPAKQALIKRCFKKLNKQKSSIQIISILYFIDRFSQHSRSTQLISLALGFSQLSKIKLANQKQSVDRKTASLNHLCNFYFKFLKTEFGKDPLDKYSEQPSIEKGVEKAQIEIEMTLLVLRSQFILNCCLSQGSKSQSGQQNLGVLICKQVLIRCHKQLIKATQFFNKWSSLILDKHQQAFAMNQIYQKLIFISKQIKKLNNLAKKLQLTLQFSTINLDREYNTKVQKSMLARTEQKKKFKTQKLIKSRKMIEMDDNIDEDDIMLQWEE